MVESVDENQWDQLQPDLDKMKKTKSVGMQNDAFAEPFERLLEVKKKIFVKNRLDSNNTFNTFQSTMPSSALHSGSIQENIAGSQIKSAFTALMDDEEDDNENDFMLVPPDKFDPY